MSIRSIFVAVAAAAAFSVHAQDGERPPFITTPQDVVEHMLRFAGTGTSDLVVDLGSGDGRIVIAAAREFGARGLGIELDEALVEKSRDNARAAKVADRVSFVKGNVLFADISQASVVTVYLLPGLINQLQPRFIEELKPGTRIVSHAFTMAGWRPDRAETVRLAQRHAGQGDQSTIFLWIVPAKARGRWIGSGAGGDLRLTVRQNFQEIEVEVERNKRPVPVTRASLSGADISWETQAMRFSGRIEGSWMAGELILPDRKTPLVLERNR